MVAPVAEAVEAKDPGLRDDVITDQACTVIGGSQLLRIPKVPRSVSDRIVGSSSSQRSKTHCGAAQSRPMTSALEPIASILPTKVSAMATRFEALYHRRKGGYSKDAQDESFLRELNEISSRASAPPTATSRSRRRSCSSSASPARATTLTSQLLAYCLDTGYVDNVAARFWLAPVQGSGSAASCRRTGPTARFESDYARTLDLHGIHEFGYFWRRWLRKERSRTSPTRVNGGRDRLGRAPASRSPTCRTRSAAARWRRRTSSPPTTCRAFGETLGQVVYVYVERDPLDAAVSILDARRKYYRDPRTWWSYTPPEVEELLKLDEWGQVAGQVHYLQRFYEEACAEAGEDVVVRRPTKSSAERPRRACSARGRAKPRGPRRENRRRAEPPAEFPFRTHEGRGRGKERFAALLAGSRPDTKAP